MYNVPDQTTLADTAPQATTDHGTTSDSTTAPSTPLKRKPGRPVGSHAPPHFTDWLRLRVSAKQIEAYQAAADKAGQPLSKWVRDGLDAMLGPFQGE